ncbi:MAG: phosphoadenylyl-sulfate reductase [Solirubrobacteraceae bacterium]|nr:phosphoadenylyl-sulfate reductase [Solirubrobacteraceae bacterium]
MARFHPGLVVATSFQKEASVILDLVMRVDPTVPVFTLDTGALFPETRDTWRAMEERYGIRIEGVRGLHLDRHWERDPDRCCDVRKVRPLRDHLAGRRAWFTGLRREQSPQRAGTPKLGWDRRHGLWKIAPLADWTERDVWRYIMAHGVPYHPLHDRGYDSIGCWPCTQPGTGRDGRWAGRTKVECGIHVA